MALVKIPIEETRRHVKDRNARAVLHNLHLPYQDNWTEADVIEVLRCEHMRLRNELWGLRTEWAQFKAKQMDPEHAVASFIEASTPVITAQEV